MLRNRLAFASSPSLLPFLPPSHLNASPAFSLFTGATEGEDSNPARAWVLSGALALITKMEKTRRVSSSDTHPPGLDYSAGGLFTDVQAVQYTPGGKTLVLLYLLFLC